MTWIQLLTEEPELHPVVERLAPRGTPVRAVAARDARSGTPPAAVVIATSGARLRFIERALSESAARGLKTRTIVLAPFSRELATGLVRLPCPRVVWLDDARRELAPLLREMVASDLRFVVSTALLDRCGEDPILRRAVEQAFVGTACPTTVAGLAARAHCTPSTLRTHWRDSGLPDSPQALVEWAILAALAEMRGDGSKVSTVSRLIGLHETTLYRAAQRRMGVSPSLVSRAALLDALDAWLPDKAG